MTTLAEYLAAANLSQSAFAARVGASRSFLCEIVSGAKSPGLALAARIEAETGGAVKAVSLIRTARPTTASDDEAVA